MLEHGMIWTVAFSLAFRAYQHLRRADISSSQVRRLRSDIGVVSHAVNMCAYFRHPISILVYVFIWLRGLHSSSAYSRHLSKISVLGQFETFYGTFLVLINPEIVSVALISRLEI